MTPAICPGCCQYVAACMCPPQQFDRVKLGPDGAYQHFYRGQPVAAPPRLVPEPRPHDWPYCAAERAVHEQAQLDAITHGIGVVSRGADGVAHHVPVSELHPDAVAATDVLVALADLEAASKARPTRSACASWRPRFARR